MGEAFPFCAGSTFRLTADNHNSVNGIREFARDRGARVDYLPIHLPGMTIDRDELRGMLKSGAGGEQQPPRPDPDAPPDTPETMGTFATLMKLASGA